MKRITFIVLFFLVIANASIYSQILGVGINTSGHTPDPSAILDISTGVSGKGFLLPQASLASSTDNTTIASPAAGLMVYNASGNINGVGYYYWTGSTWLFMENTNICSYWSCLGNANTTVGTDFIGTTTTAPNAFEIKVDAHKSGYLDYTTPYNTLFGFEAGNGITTGTSNTAAGYTALYTNSTGLNNTAVGYNALYTNGTASSNTALGAYAGYNAAESWNTFVGDSAGYNTTAGKYNTCIGYGAGKANTVGCNEIYIGDSTGVAAPNAVKFAGVLELYYSNVYNAGTSTYPLTSQGAGAAPQWIIAGTNQWVILGNALTTPGPNFLGTTDAEPLEFKVDAIEAGWLDYSVANSGSGTYGGTFFGCGAGASNTGLGNTGLGYHALNANTSPGYNSALGFEALQVNNIAASIPGQYNTALGYYTLLGNTSGSNNVAIGNYTMGQNTTGSNNTACGNNAIDANSTGNYNTAFGAGSAYTNSTGSNNTSVAHNALGQNSVSNNTGIGYTALQNNSTGTPNTGLGYQALSANTLGGNNVAVGDNALQTNSLVGGTKNTAAGSGADVSTTGLSNTIELGYGTKAHNSNAGMIGNASADSLTTYAILCVKNATTTVAGSTAGTIVFSEPFGGADFKEIDIYLNGTNGHGSYTFPIAFSHTPAVVISSYAGAPAIGVVSAISTTAVTITTGSVTSGIITLQGF